MKGFKPYIVIFIFAAILIIFNILEPQTVTAPKKANSPNALTASNTLWGAYTGDDTLDGFEQRIGKQVNINAVFVGWDEPFPSQFDFTVRDKGKTLVIFWEQYGITLDEIIAGNSDSYINQFATQAKEYKGPVILAPFHEMNGTDPWGGTVGNNTPAKIISAWKHVHGLFAGITNVKFGWVVNNVSVPDTQGNQIENYYPGGNYVDYVGVDGFNFGDPWQTFSEVFSSSIEKLKTFNKPIFIFSMACAEGPKKANWIYDALSKIYSNPSVAGWIWFNENKEENWLIWSNSDSLKTFQSSIIHY